MAADGTANWEKQVKRNPHPDFKQVEASRPPFDASTTFHYTQTPSPDWTFGSGANSAFPSSSSSSPSCSSDSDPEKKKHIRIDPYAPGRPAALNYKLLISAIIPRPIALVSTQSADGSQANLAPFSYFSVIGHDPPLFTIGFAHPSSSPSSVKDTLRHLRETGECVVNIISEPFLEAANSCSVDAPPGVSEWAVSGLTPLRDCETVRPARVGEAVFSFEARLESLREFESRVQPGRVTTTLAVLEGTRFWAREDAVNEEGSLLDPKVRQLFCILCAFCL